MSLFDIERVALERLSPVARDYYASGADDEITLRHNREAFERIPLHYKVLVDVGRRALATTVLGEAIAMPVMVAPTAFHRLAHSLGEIGVTLRNPEEIGREAAIDPSAGGNPIPVDAFTLERIFRSAVKGDLSLKS